MYHPYTHSPQPHLPRTPHQHRLHPRPITFSQHTHMQHKQQYMHHSHCNKHTHNIGYHDNLTDRPRTTTGLQTPHKHTSSSSCHQTSVFHLSTHFFAVSLNLLRSSNEQGCARRVHCIMCAVFSVARPHSQVVSPS